MSMKSWTVVKFDDENTVEAVPSSWILGNSCYWPPYARDKLVAAIKNFEAPNTHWPLHKMDIFRNGTFDSYLEARKKSTSDLNIEEGPATRKNRHRQSVAAAIAPDVCCCCPAHEQIVQTGTIDMNKIKKQYLFMTNIMADIKSELSEIKAVVVSAQQHPIPPLNESIFKKISLPINDEGAPEVLEEYLRSEANFQKAVPKISNMGGNSIYDFVERSLTILITNKFANKFSFLGKKQKASFNKLKICELVINAAEHSRVSCSRKEAEESISKWLRRANERKGD